MTIKCKHGDYEGAICVHCIPVERAELEALQAENARLREEVERLRAQNSSQSSQLEVLRRDVISFSSRIDKADRKQSWEEGESLDQVTSELRELSGYLQLQAEIELEPKSK